MALSKKQKFFVEYYLQTWNATQSAIKAGYSKRSAGVIGYENLTKPQIAEEIQRRIDDVVMTSNEVLTNLSDIARSNVESLMDINDRGQLTFNFKRAQAEGKLHLIKSIIPTAYGTKVELHDRMKALELIGKHNGLFMDRVDVTSNGDTIKAVGFDIDKV